MIGRVGVSEPSERIRTFRGAPRATISGTGATPTPAATKPSIAV
jgi:hypothetical protein